MKTDERHRQSRSRVPAKPRYFGVGDHLQRGAPHRRVPGDSRLVRRGSGGRLLLHGQDAGDRPELPQGPLSSTHLFRIGFSEELGDGPGQERLDPDHGRRRASHAGTASGDRRDLRSGSEVRHLHHQTHRLLPRQGDPLLRMAARPGGEASQTRARVAIRTAGFTPTW